MAYNVRHSKSINHDPATGNALDVNRLREVGAWAFGVAVMYLVYWLTRRYLM
jgi:hypothetical protein